MARPALRAAPGPRERGVQGWAPGLPELSAPRSPDYHLPVPSAGVIALPSQSWGNG